MDLQLLQGGSVTGLPLEVWGLCTVLSVPAPVYPCLPLCLYQYPYRGAGDGQWPKGAQTLGPECSRGASG